MSLGIVAESDLVGNLKSEYVFFDGERVARKDFPGNTISYYFSDHLKAASVITVSAGNIKSESDYYPWGGELQFINNDSNHYKFTGKERDVESGLDYFGKRYYSSAMSRWTSPDPISFSKKHLAFPQRWNKYSYVQNDPLGRIDPDGLDDFKVFLAPQASGDWKKAEAVAKAHGHTLEVFTGERFTTANFQAALMSRSNRVVFVGDTSRAPSAITPTPQPPTMTGVVFSDGRSAGTNAEINTLKGNTIDKPIALEATIVAADTVALFGCNSIGLSSQFSGSNNFVGVDSGTDHLSTFPAQSAGVEAFVEADAAARPNGSTGPVRDSTVDAANQAFQNNRHVGPGVTDFDGDKVTKLKKDN